LNKDGLYFPVSIELTGCRETLIAFQNLLDLCLSLFLTLQLGFPNNPYPFDKVPLQKTFLTILLWGVTVMERGIKTGPLG